jgi:putative acetyltransferase
MIHLIRTQSDHKDFQELVRALDIDLKIRDGEEHSFFAQFNKIDSIKHVVLAYNQDTALACGAIKAYDSNTMEIKRMFVAPEFRGQGIASLVLSELEKWSRELHFKQCILETGQKQPEAIRLYHKNNYTLIPNFGQYAGVESSVCFEKIL